MNVLNSVQVLHFSAPDKMYIGSNEGGLVVLSTLSGKMNFWGSRQGLSDHIKSLYLEDNTKLWLGYDNGDADIVDLNNNTVKHLNTSKVFNNNALCHITKTSGGVVFLSSIGFGLGEYAPEHCDLNFISIEDGLNSNTVWGLLQDSKGNIWVGSENGINVISATDKKNYSLPGYDVVETIMEDKKGNVWFGCTGGTFRIRSTDGVIEQFLVNPEDMLQRTCVLYEDSRGWIWMGKNEGGLNVYNPETGEMSLLSKADGLPGNKVRNIREGKDGKMWLGTLGNGMAIYDPEKKTLQQLNERNGLCNNNVLELLIDKDSLIWIGTYGGGVDVYNPRNGLIANYSLEQGIADATINSILEKNGRFYLGTGLGLYVMEKQGMRNGEPEFSVTAYGRTQGFSSTDYNTNSELLTRNGQLWWGIGDYLTIMKEPKKNLLAPETKITAIDLGGGLNRFYTDAFIKEALKQHDTLWFQEKDTFYTWQQPVHIQNQAAGKHVTWESIAPPWFIPQHLVLPYGNNEIGISFTGLQFDNIDKTVYRYFLHGQDTGWSEMTTRAQVSYSNLLAGDYTFYVCSRSFDGVWSKPASFSFAVSLPWWQTKLAYTLYLAILIGVITGYNRLKTLQLRNRQKVLEEIIALHTEKVVTQKEEIEKHRAKILESINYARHIQSSILDDKENIGKSIGEAFILFRPLEIVSGDFYWYYRKDDYSIIACIDCTGHGVPGAFMSMIGSMLLNAIVKEQGVVEPGEIMKRLHAGVVSALHQETIEKSQEGMELALCTINHQSGKMRFCGARSAIYVMNKDGLKRYKSGLLPIGGMYMKKGRAMDLKFESLEIELDEHTWVYMSTDGFPDQFGGNQRDSFTFGRMETSIKEAYPKNANEQEKFFSDTLNKWMQGSIQNDDILLLGFRAKLG